MKTLKPVLPSIQTYDLTIELQNLTNLRYFLGPRKLRKHYNCKTLKHGQQPLKYTVITNDSLVLAI